MEKQEFTSVYRKLIIRFIISMILIATILVLKQTIIYYQIKQEENTAYIVNIAGRQRMLSQKITKNIAFITGDNKDLSPGLYVEDLDKSLTMWQTSHQELLDLNKKVNYLGANLEKEIFVLFNEIEPSFNIILSSSSNILEDYRENTLNRLSDDIEAVYKTEGVYLEKMDNIVSAYEKEALLSIQLIKKTQMLLFGLILLMLVFVGYRIVYPLLSYLKKSNEKSSEFRENLTRIFRSMQGAIFIINFSGDILVMNQSAKALNLNGQKNNPLPSLSNYLNWLDIGVNDIISKFNNDVDRIDDFETVIEDGRYNIVNVVLSAFKATYKGEKTIVISLFDITAQKQAEQILENIALKDELTGLYNRHFLNSIISEEIKVASTYKIPLSIALIDLDHFKRVNDIYGHPVGDEVLQLTAKTIKNNIEISHFAIRFGGEKFLIVMPNTNVRQAKDIVESFRKELENSRHPVSGKITASAGLVQFNGESDFKDLYLRADKALYQAKAGGRNKIKVA